MFNVLIFPYLTNGREIEKSLAHRYEFNIIIGHSEDIPIKHIKIPYISNYSNIVEYIDIFNEIIEKNKIDYIFITHDNTLAKISPYRHLLKAKLVHPNDYFCQISNNKAKTYSELSKLIPKYIPKIYNYTTISEIDLPIYVKPISGAGSRDNHIIYNIQDISYYNNNKYILSEYLTGEEYTVDCFSQSGKLLYFQSRTRELVKAGISNRSITTNKHNKEIEYIANIISENYDIDGLWFFQVKEDKNGDIKLLEVCARASGTICANLAVGVNLPLIALYNVMNNSNKDIKIIKTFDKGRVDRYLHNVYYLNINYENIYVDFDDTILINGKINHELIGFLYREKYNNNKKIYLITKHKSKDLNQLLEKYNLKGLFNDVYHLRQCEHKADYIKGNSIFIDDSFSERYKVLVKKNNNVHVFDVNLELLSSL